MTDTTAETTAGTTTPAPRRRRSTAVTSAGALCAAVPLAAALLGPFVAPQAPSGTAPLQPPGGEFLLGTDALGRDVLGLLLTGGGSVVLLAVTTLLVSSAVGVPLGLLLAATRRRALDTATLRILDVVMVLPSLLILLVLAATGRRGFLWVVVAVAIVQLPALVRLVRAAAAAPACRTALEAMTMAGEPWWRVHLLETGRRALGPMVVDSGTRVVLVVGLVTTANFLGVGLPPTAVDWGVIVQQNQTALFLAPLPVVAPVALIAALCLGANLLADSLLERPGRLG